MGINYYYSKTKQMKFTSLIALVGYTAAIRIVSKDCSGLTGQAKTDCEAGNLAQTKETDCSALSGQAKTDCEAGNLAQEEAACTGTAEEIKACKAKRAAAKKAAADAAAKKAADAAAKKAKADAAAKKAAAAKKLAQTKETDCSALSGQAKTDCEAGNLAQTKDCSGLTGQAKTDCEAGNPKPWTAQALPDKQKLIAKLETLPK